MSSFIARMGEDATLEARTLDTGSRDGETNWPPETYGSEDIKIFVDEIITREVDILDAGRITEKRMRAFIEGDVSVTKMDRITYHGEIFEIESVETPEYLYGTAQFKRLFLMRVTD